MLVSRGAAAVTAICLLAAPEGVARLERRSRATRRLRSGWNGRA